MQNHPLGKELILSPHSRQMISSLACADLLVFLKKTLYIQNDCNLIWVHSVCFQDKISLMCILTLKAPITTAGDNKFCDIFRFMG